MSSSVYTKMKVGDLKALISSRGLEIPKGAKKADLIDLLLFGEKKEGKEPESDSKDVIIPTEEEVYKMTGKSLKELVAKLGFKVPANIGKVPEVREWVAGALKERASGFNVSDTCANYPIPYDKLQKVWMPTEVEVRPYLKGRDIPIRDGPITQEELDRLASLDPDNAWVSDIQIVDDMVKVDWAEHLLAFGWAVIPHAVNAKQLRELTSEFWDWLESFRLDRDPHNPSTFDRNDPKTWKKAYMSASAKGIFKQMVNHEDFVWKARRYTKRYFDELYDSEDLAVSFDGAGFLTPPSEENKGVVVPWLHFDQFRYDNRRICIQGILCLTDSKEEDGGFCFLKPDNMTVGEYFSTYMDRHPSGGICWTKTNQKDPIVKNVPIRKVCALKGDMIVFDSRLMHANVGSQRNARMTIYVSYQPRSNISKEIAADRLDAFNKGIGTGHWVFGPWYGRTAAKPHTFGAPLYGPTIENKPSYEEVKDMI